MNNENRYYVYFHRLKETNEIFYIGKGTRLRLRNQHNRNAKWKEVTSANAWYFEVYAGDLTDNQAKALELELIHRFNPVANHQKKDVSAREVRFQDFNKLYYYCETSPSGLRYLIGNKQSGKKKRYAGDIAGTLNSSGYYSVHYKYSNYFAHRVIWCLVNNCNIKEELVDHIDHNRSNNKISNLRLATPSENNKNSSLKSHNKTGYNGVTYTSTFNLYVATWVESDGRQETKSFSGIKHGEPLALGLAAEYRHRVTANKNGYLENPDYIRHESLVGLSENDIQEMLDCDIRVTNTSGINRVCFQKVRGHSFWIYRYGRDKGVRFSCTKYGNIKAKELAIEYKDYLEKSKGIEEISPELKSEIENPTRANNQTGIRNISFIGEDRDIVLVQVMVKYKNYTKSFHIKELGLIPAMAQALQWRDNMKNNYNGGCFGA